MNIKDVPKKIIHGKGCRYNTLYCPTCNKDLYLFRELKVKYCPYCGQRIVWEEGK